MRILRYGLSLAFIALGSSALAAEPSACKAVADEYQASTQRVVQTFQTEMEQFRSQTDAETETLKSEQPKSSTAENMIGIKFNVEWTDERYSLDVPEITLRDQKVSMDLPVTVMTTQQASFDEPVTRMVTTCYPGLPETVCGTRTEDIGFGAKIDVPYCVVRTGPDYCIDTPQVTMERRDISFDVPETTMKTQEFVVGVPEVAMKRTEIVLTVPQFTVIEVKGERADYESKAKQFGNDKTAEANAKNETFKGELSSAIAEQKQAIGTCQVASIDNQRNSALLQIDNAIAVLTAGLDKARELNATAQVQSLADTLRSLIAKRDEVVSSFNKAREEVAKNLT